MHWQLKRRFHELNFQKQPEFKQAQQVQSFYEPALRLLGHLFEQKSKTCAARVMTKTMQRLPKLSFLKLWRQFRITQWLAQQVVTAFNVIALSRLVATLSQRMVKYEKW
jgi:hypothetical protein